MKVHRVPLGFAAVPPSIASQFLNLVQFGSQCSAIIIISFKKDMEILKMMTTILKKFSI